MKYVLVVVLFFFAEVATAQKFSECKVYQYQGNKVKSKHLVLTDIYNKKGKIVKEIANGYEIYLVPGETESYSQKEDGTYYYSYDDTLLKGSLFVSPVCELHGCDSIRIQYFYNPNKTLAKELKYEHSTAAVTKVSPKTLKPQTQYLTYRWQEPETVVHTYFPSGLPKELQITPRKPLPHETIGYNKASHYYAYDGEKRMILDSIAYVDDLKGDLKNVTKYTYTDYGYDAHCYAFHFHSVDQVHIDDKGKIIEEDERMLNKSTMSSKTLNKYNKNGNIISSQHYENGVLTTTRLYVYK